MELVLDQSKSGQGHNGLQVHSGYFKKINNQLFSI